MIAPATKQPVQSAAQGPRVDYDSVERMTNAQKLEFLKRPDFDPFKLRNGYDYLNAQMYRWVQIAKNTEAGGYTPEQKTKIAEAAWDRMIGPYYAGEHSNVMTKDEWMKNAYDVGAKYDMDRAYRGGLYTGGSHGTMSLMEDAIQAGRTFTNIIGGALSSSFWHDVIKPPEEITDASWQKHLKDEKAHPYQGFWHGVREYAEHFNTVKAINKTLDSASDKVEFLQKLRPNKGYIAAATSFTVEAMPWMAAAALPGGQEAAIERGGIMGTTQLEAWMGDQYAGRLAAGVTHAARDGFIYGTLTRKEEDKSKNLDDAIDWAVATAALHVGGDALVRVGGKFIPIASDAGAKFMSQMKNYGDMISKKRRLATPSEISEESEAGAAEVISKHGIAGQEALDNHAAEYLTGLETSGLSQEAIFVKEKNMLEHGTAKDRAFLDTVNRLREALKDNKLTELSDEQKTLTLSRMLALRSSAAGKMTKYVATLQEALRQRFVTMPTQQLNKNVMSYLMQDVAKTLPQGASNEQLVEAVKKRWSDLVVEAGTWAEDELEKDPLGEAAKSNKMYQKALTEFNYGKAVGVVSRTRRITGEGVSGVSYSYAPAWKVYAQSRVGRGDEWNSENIKKWLDGLSEDDFAADLHYFLPPPVREGNIHFESGKGEDHSNLYAFAWNYKDTMPKEYAERLEEEFLNSPKMERFYQGASKEERPKLARKFALGMWNHVDNFFGSGRFPKEQNIFRSTYDSDLNNPTRYQKDLFAEREKQELKIIDQVFKKDTPENRNARNILQVLSSERRKSYRADEQTKMRFGSERIKQVLGAKAKGTRYEKKVSPLQ